MGDLQRKRGGGQVNVKYRKLDIEPDPRDIGQQQVWYAVTTPEGDYICTVEGWIPAYENRRVWTLCEPRWNPILQGSSYLSRDEAVRAFIKYDLRLEGEL